MPSAITYRPSQLVAMNLRRARELRGWTQAQARQHLYDNGVPWEHPQQMSAAEAGADPKKRGRSFTADELVGMARAFGVPITWFFLPPEGDDEAAVMLDRESISGVEYLQALFEIPEEVRDRLNRSLPFLTEASWDIVQSVIDNVLTVKAAAAIGGKKQAYQVISEQFASLAAVARLMHDVTPTPDELVTVIKKTVKNLQPEGNVDD